MSSIVLTVSQINLYIKSIFDGDKKLNPVYVCGEISNLNKHYSGHYYFSLKDSGGVLRCVMFKSAVEKLRFNPENGMRVIIRGRISVYERDGQYQLYAQEMQPDGIGTLQIAYEQLKERLQKAGIFDNEYKKEIPKYPSKVGVITSPTGAAVRDIMSILARRYPLAEVVFYPVQVQGDGAEQQLINAIEYIDAKKAADVIIIGRGGGSIEDLWAFNSEKLAIAIFKCEIPVISAVGHETDFTICDFVADLRAPTPSAAAELAVPDLSELIMHLKNLIINLTNNYLKIIDDKKDKLTELISHRSIKYPLELIDIRRQDLDNYTKRLMDAYNTKIKTSVSEYKHIISKLDALSPLKVLARGYAIVQSDNKIIKSVKEAEKDDQINVRLSDGNMKCIINEINYVK